MKIKESVIERCKKCSSYLKQTSPEIYGCDTCKKEIDMEDDKYKNKVCPYLTITIFYNNRDEDAEDMQFCSWKCMFKKLKTLKNKKDIDFISLPCLSFDRDINDKYRGDLFKCLNLKGLS